MTKKMAGAPINVKPCYDSIHDKSLYLERDVTSRSGVRVKSRIVAEVKSANKRGGMIPEGILKDDSEDYAKPYMRQEMRGSSRGGIRGGVVDFKAMAEGVGGNI